jgi:hypothetical protein
MRFLPLLLISYLCSPLLRAEEDEKLGYFLDLGSMQFNGSMSDSKSETTYGFELTFPHGNKNEMLAFGFSTFSADGRASGAYPGGPEDTIHGLQVTMQPNRCWGLFAEISGCVGAGLTYLRLSENSGKNEAEYGNYIGTLRLGRYNLPGLVYGLKIGYTRFAQTIEDETYFAELVPISLQVGWHL